MIPSGKRLHSMENRNFSWVSQLSMAIFNSKLLVYQREIFISPGFFRGTSPSTASDALRRQLNLTSQRRPAVATRAPGGSEKKGVHTEMGKSGLNTSGYTYIYIVMLDYVQEVAK